MVKKTKTQRQDETNRRLAQNAAADLQVVEAPATAGDQNDVASVASPATDVASGDQNDVKAKRKASPTVVKWREAKKAPVPQGIIRIQKDYAKNCPKRSKGANGAKERFEMYRDGMTVAEYIEVATKANWPKALIQDDVRWDIIKGFIVVE